MADQTVETEYDNEVAEQQDVEAEAIGEGTTLPPIIKNRLQDTISSGYMQLDLSRCKISAMPNEALAVSSLRHLYLAENSIEELPDTIFQQLPNLEWLDVRRNKLRTLANVTAGLIAHSRLRNLLVSGNKIIFLPPELGLVKSLTGLSVFDNPIEFPPEEVLANGTTAILNFLKQAFTDSVLQKQPTYSRDVTGVTTDDEGDTFPVDQQISRKMSPHRRQSPNRSPSPRRQSRALEMLATLTAANIVENLEETSATSPLQLSKSAVLHAHLTNQGQIRQIYIDKLKNSSAALLGVKTSQKTKKKKKIPSDAQVSLYPEPPSMKKAQQKARDEQEKQQERDTNEKILGELQRMKHADYVERWRTDAKMLQRDASFSQHIKSEGEIQDELETRVRRAPFHVEDADLRMQNNDDRLQKRTENIKKEKPRALSPETLERNERRRHNEEVELEERVYRHTEAMRERRKKSAGKNGRDRSTVEEARMELEVALRLKREIESRRRELELAMRQ